MYILPPEVLLKFQRQRIILLHTRYEVESIYDKNRQTYIYDLKKSDIFFLVSDGKDKNGENDILKAIKLAGNKDIYFIRWDNEQQL